VVESSIYLPRHDSALPPELVELLQSPDMAPQVRLLMRLGSLDVAALRDTDEYGLLSPYGDEVLDQAIQQVLLATTATAEPSGDLESETDWRRPEFQRSASAATIPTWSSPRRGSRMEASWNGSRESSWSSRCAKHGLCEDSPESGTAG
jgi:hypothetical protein